MYFSQKELTRLLGLQPIEIWLHMISMAIFSVLFIVKVESHVNFNWWMVFIPLFAADGVHCYFIYIVMLRMAIAGIYKAACLKALWSYAILGLLFVFKLLLCMKLSGQFSMDYAEVLSPIMMMLQLFMIRACQIH